MKTRSPEVIAESIMHMVTLGDGFDDLQIVYQSQTEDGKSMTADTLREDDPTTNTGLVDQCGNPIYRIPGKSNLGL
jgi:hypothetical protein